MSNRATTIRLLDSSVLCAGEPILDTQEGVLIIQFEDGTSRVFNWDFVIDYYYMTEEELRQLREMAGEE